MIEVTYIDHMGSDLSVVNAARVSFGKQSEWMPRVHNGEAKVLQLKDDRLIKYLAKHKHISPFGHAFASFHVKAPVYVARQLVEVMSMMILSFMFPRSGVGEALIRSRDLRAK